jgi:hypothetical protein
MYRHKTMSLSRPSAPSRARSCGGACVHSSTGNIQLGLIHVAALGFKQCKARILFWRTLLFPRLLVAWRSGSSREEVSLGEGTLKPSTSAYSSQADGSLCRPAESIPWAKYAASANNRGD